jgi:hypothetical protein
LNFIPTSSSSKYLPGMVSPCVTPSDTHSVIDLRDQKLCVRAGRVAAKQIEP